jgi:putative transposase
MCAFRKTCLFGGIENDIVVLSPVGKIVRDCWADIPNHFASVRLGVFVVMPNHLHGILTVEERARHAVPLQVARNLEQFQGPTAASIPTIVRSFKSAVTRLVREHAQSQAIRVWQSNYFERILRNGDELEKATRYIVENPLHWHMDKYR